MYVQRNSDLKFPVGFSTSFIAVNKKNEVNSILKSVQRQFPSVTVSTSCTTELNTYLFHIAMATEMFCQKMHRKAVAPTSIHPSTIRKIIGLAPIYTCQIFQSSWMEQTTLLN
jgi:hypothetical protein